MTKRSIEIWQWAEDRAGFALEAEHDIFFGQGGWVAVGDFYGDSSLDVYVLVNATDCQATDVAPLNTHDVLLVGPECEGYVRASHALGCADRAYPVDGTKILILNGRVRTRGPVEVADLRTSVAPLAPLPDEPEG